MPNLGTTDIYNNNIHDLSNTSSNATSHRVCGIRISLTGAIGSISNIYNNIIYNLENSSGYTLTAISQILGIYVQDAQSGTNAIHNINFNSVRLSPVNLNCQNSCFEIGTTSGPVIKVQNNIFANFTEAQTGNAKHYCWVTGTANSIGPSGSISNYNNLYVNNSGNGFVGLDNMTNRSTLSNWRTAVGNDLNSVSGDPGFTSPTNLKPDITKASCWNVERISFAGFLYYYGY